MLDSTFDVQERLKEIANLVANFDDAAAHDKRDALLFEVLESIAEDHIPRGDIEDVVVETLKVRRVLDSIFDVQDRLKEIENFVDNGDYAAAHGKRDALLFEVLTSIAEDHIPRGDIEDVVVEALKVRNAKYSHAVGSGRATGR
jgi:hemerythrin-like domain-containing protein